MFKEGTKQILFRVCSAQRFADGSGKLLNIVRNEVSRVGVFRSVPHLLIRVEVGGVRRQPFDVQPSGKTPSQTACGRTMHRPTVPHQDNAFEKMLQQCSNETFSLVGGDIPFEYVEIETQSAPMRRERDCRDGRQPIPSVPAIVNRRLPFGSPSATDGRLQHKAAFIRENNGFTASSTFFSYSASAVCANRQWPLRCARGHAFRAFGNSSPCGAAHAIRPMHRTSHRSACVSTPQPAAGSIIPCSNPVAWHRLRAVAPTALTDFRSAGSERRDAVWLSKPPGRPAETPLPIDRPPRASRQNGGPPRTETILDSAAPWPEADAAPHSCRIVKLPYKTVSAYSTCLNKLFKVQ